MRILLIHQFFLEDNAGGGARWNEMSRIWTESGHEITVLAGMTHYMDNRSSRYVGKYFHEEVNKDKIRVIRCFSGKVNGCFMSRLWSYFSFAFSGIIAGLFYATDRYDVIIVSSPPLFIGIAGIFLSWWKNIPFVFEVRDLWPESAIDMGLLKNKQLIRLSYRFESLIYKRASLINVLTPAFRAVLVEQKAISPDKIIFIPNASDFTISENLFSGFDSRSFRKLHDLEGKFVIIYVGAHGIANHLIQILDTAGLLRDTRVLFLFIGDGAEKGMLKKETVRRKLENVRFIDSMPKTEVFKFILASDMGTSVLKKTDTFKTIYSNKTFDYFSCKKAVLLAIDGISRVLIEKADAGIFVEPENPADFAKKIRFYLNNPEWTIKQGENGYLYAKNHFDREVLAIKYLNYIREIGKH